MAEVLQVLQAAAFTSAILGAAVAIWNLKGFARDRRTHLVLDIFSHIGTFEFSENFAKIIKAQFNDAREAEEKCSFVTLIMIGNYYEGVGLLIRRGLVDADLVFESLPFYAVWDKMKPWCLDRRRLLGDSSIFEHFEYAAVLNRAREDAKHRRERS